MKAIRLILLTLFVTQAAQAQVVTPSPRNKSSLQTLDPGTFSVEGMTPKPVVVKVQLEAPVYPSSKLQGALGSFAPGTLVMLIAMSDTAYRVRGRARHGDVAGWVRQTDVISPDPNLATNLKKLHERTAKVEELIQNHQVALGMTSQEVQASLGKPSRTSAKVNAQGKEEKLEFSIYDRVPQTTTGRDAFGNLVQTVVYVKVEVGTLGVSFKDGVVSEIEETKGNPLGGGGVQIVPPPFVF
ncbi:MAG: hypothetical protein IAE77_05020 [Prosthecobacter sp.]|jgi:hypothetical protein|uniref:hypothetical protein n=1 Tax=Prosthecobacter sp. TaxID=1965333 RepID=UPI0019D8A3E8|nr:hypothetical protein [Prosthecobacter sp.]MBE2282804.1 hypothetical protein [Prosthecobacter sp.]